MSKFFIEVEHDEAESACIQAVEIFLQTGSHFLTNAEWGCTDGEHKAWIIMDAEDKEQARCILPSAYRNQAKIVQLSKFTLEEIDEIRRQHAL
jgi:hypothetical protein